MSIDFFQKKCQEKIDNEIFGLCDDNNGKVAYTDKDNRDKWIATVINNKKKQIVFTAIDKCIILDSEYPDRERCDCMLTFDDYIYFIELKNKRKGWKASAIKQLKSTIKFFIEQNNDNKFRYKKAFICNKKHPYFNVIDNEFELTFFREYGFRISVQSEILID